MSAKDEQIKFLQYRVEALEKELKKQKAEIILINQKKNHESNRNQSLRDK